MKTNKKKKQLLPKIQSVIVMKYELRVSINRIDKQQRD